MPLPFRDGTYDGVFCLDAFHYIRSKAALAGEMQRVINRDGVVLLAHLHNARTFNPAAGIPCTDDVYARFFSNLPIRIFAEPRLLNDLCVKHEVDLREPDCEETLSTANAFCLVAGRRPWLWRRYPLTDLLLRSRDTLSLNPIYKAERNGHQVYLKMDWPNEGLAAECSAILDLMPEQLTLEAGLLERILSRTTLPEDAPRLASLAESFVVIHLPNTY
jgi:SAM-dependent methyltransferase